MTTNLLCSVHVNEDSNIYLQYPESVLTTAIEHQQHRLVNTDIAMLKYAGGERKSQFFHLPQSIRTGGGDKCSFEKKLKCSLEESCVSHISDSSAGHSTFPRTEGFLKGYMETQHYLPRLFSSIKYCIIGLIKVLMLNSVLFIDKH